MSVSPDPNATPDPNGYPRSNAGKVLILGLLGGAIAGGAAALAMMKFGGPAAPKNVASSSPAAAAAAPVPDASVPAAAVPEASASVPASEPAPAKLGFRMGAVEPGERIESIKVTLLVGPDGEDLTEPVDLHLGLGFPLRLWPVGGDSRTPSFAAFPQQASLAAGSNRLAAGSRATFEFQARPGDPGADKLRTTPQLLSDLKAGDVRGVGFASRGAANWRLGGYVVEINGKLFAADDSLDLPAAEFIAQAQSELDRLYAPHEVLAKEKRDLEAYVATGLGNEDDKKALAAKTDELAKSAEPINRLAAVIAGAAPWYQEANPAFKPAAWTGDAVKSLEITLITGSSDRPGSRNPVYLWAGGRKYLLASEADPLSDEPVRQRFKLWADELAAAPLSKDDLKELGIGMVGNDQRFGKVPDRAKLQRVIVEADGKPTYDSETVAGDRQTLEAIWLVPPAHRDETGKEVANTESPTELYLWKVGATISTPAPAPTAAPAAEPPATEPIANPLNQPLPNDSPDPLAGAAPPAPAPSGTATTPPPAAATGGPPGGALAGGTPPGTPGGGLPSGELPGAGLPGAGLPGAGLPGAGLPGAGLPGTGLPVGGIGGTFGGGYGSPYSPAGYGDGLGYGLLPPLRRNTLGANGLQPLPGIIINIPAAGAGPGGRGVGGGGAAAPGAGGVPPGAIGGGLRAVFPAIPPAVPAPAVPTIANVRLNPNLAILRNGDTATVNWQVIGNASQVTSYRVDLFAVMPHLAQPLLAPAVSTRANVAPPVVAAAGGGPQAMTATVPAISTAALTIGGAPLTNAQLCYLYVQPKVTALGPGGAAELTSAFGPIVPLSVQGTLPFGVALTAGVPATPTVYSYFLSDGAVGPQPYAGLNDPGLTPSAWLPGNDTAAHNALTFAASPSGGLPGAGATYHHAAARPTGNGTQLIAVKFEGSVIQPGGIIAPAGPAGPNGYRVIAHVGYIGGNPTAADAATIQSRVQVGYAPSASVFTPIGAAEDFFRMETAAPLPVPKTVGAGPAPMVLIDMPIRFDKFNAGTAATDTSYFDPSKYQVSNWNNTLFRSLGTGRIVVQPGGGVVAAASNYVSVTYMISLRTADPNVAVGVFGVRLVPDNSP